MRHMARPPFPGCIYVAPPDRHIILRKGRIELSARAKVRHTRPAADPLFISAAEAYGAGALDVVLSGGDGDGARGLRIIRRHGGTAVVQCPDEAANPEMPISAMLTSHPYVLSLAKISHRVADFCAIQGFVA